MEIRSIRPELTSILFLGRKYWYHSKDPVQISSFTYSFNVVLGLLGELLELLKEYVKHESEASQALDLISIQIS